ncbi:hypothetical protein KSP39_PZI013288 [Platanthera zijinensis]|uniref:WRC domain-containing protein n=1 Tax=Platanthera zijinensis TaxID=2320716 RepID=A0AAP0G3J8_9ASPA
MWREIGGNVSRKDLIRTAMEEDFDGRGGGRGRISISPPACLCAFSYSHEDAEDARLDVSTTAAGAVGLLREPICSFLVDDSINLPPPFRNIYRGFAKSNEEEEMEMDGVVKSDCKSKEEEEDDESLEEIVKDKKEMSDEKRPSSRDSRESAEAEAAGMKCKKTDGKGWHCKRAAQIPHSLCSYHLTQVRSYRTRFEDQIHGNGSRGNSKRREKPASAGDTGGVASNYYYYSVIGPWWGKRRGPINGRESSESDISAQEHDDNTDNVGVGDDEEEDDEGSRCDHVIYKKKRPLNKKKKKRGRKPVKARSLKSLL